ncbi:8331_t:CDS:1 [Funneliformis caledonium]|uniref:8331_t:CDS:1 n=1 Tax=Funneliformis caledonium TaxID=1117310 RepID=A0A9N8ZUE4_9GLOM|nr:8331_t:CDS:1 [Funneliformis caledonium]
MNPTRSQIQASNSENFSPSVSLTCYAISQDNNILTVPSQPNLELVIENSNNSHVIQSSVNNSTPIQTDPFGNPQIPIQPVQFNTFFFRPPNDYYQYHVNCEKISIDLILQLLNKRKENIMQLKENKYIFFYQQRSNNQFYQFYQISCEIVSPSFINDWLNKNIYGIEFEQNMVQEQFVFTLDQEKHLEIHLSQYLNNHFLN